MPLYSPPSAAGGSVATDVIWDTKGDIAVATAADTAAKLAVGAGGDALVVDSNATTGLKWTTRTPFAGHRPSGSKIETIPFTTIGAASVYAMVSGTLFVALLSEPLRGGETYTSISFATGAQGISGGTHQQFCLVKASDRTVLRSTTDDTSGAWGSNTLKTLNLASTYSPAADTQAYLGIMVTASTMPWLRRYTLANALTGYSPTINGTSNTSLTAIPADGVAITAVTFHGDQVWGCVS